MEMTEGDLDDLDMAEDRDAYWQVLNRIVDRVQSPGKPGERSTGGKGGAS
jgi:hypothetical protein